VCVSNHGTLSVAELSELEDKISEYAEAYNLSVMAAQLLEGYLP
jgi:hypothetical protein